MGAMLRKLTIFTSCASVCITFVWHLRWGRCWGNWRFSHVVQAFALLFQDINNRNKHVHMRSFLVGGDVKEIDDFQIGIRRLHYFCPDARLTSIHPEFHLFCRITLRWSIDHASIRKDDNKIYFIAYFNSQNRTFEKMKYSKSPINKYHGQIKFTKSNSSWCVAMLRFQAKQFAH